MGCACTSSSVIQLRPSGLWTHFPLPRQNIGRHASIAPPRCTHVMVEKGEIWTLAAEAHVGVPVRPQGQAMSIELMAIQSSSCLISAGPSVISFGPSGGLIAHCSLLIAHCSLLTGYWPSVIGHCFAQCPLLIGRRSLLIAHWSLLVAHSSLAVANCPLFIGHCSLRALQLR